MTIDLDTFRQCLRRWPSGVTIVTAKAGDEMHGMTVSAFSSVSAEPPLILVCANRNSRTHAVVQKAGGFAVNILAADQQDLSNRFSSSKTEASRFEGVAHRIGETGAPVLEGTCVTMECRTKAAYDEGTHCIYIGEIVAAHFTDKDPLVYAAGGYRGLTAL